MINHVGYNLIDLPKSKHFDVIKFTFLVLDFYRFEKS